MFETTSLNGTTKSVSQYDGMKPFLRHKVETVADCAPLINDAKYRQLKSWFEDKMGEELVSADGSSRKLKYQTKMVSIIKSSLRGVDEDAYNKFCQTFRIHQKY